MSFLCTIMEFMNNLCLEETDISNILKDIDGFNREYTKADNQIEELDREHIRLQIELSTLKMITPQYQRIDNENNTKITKKLYQGVIEINKLLTKLDFTKILQCRHMELEAKCRQEWEEIQERFVITLKWHDKMAQRHIVQKYNQNEIVFRNTEETLKNQQETIKKSSQQSQKIFSETMEKRNEIIVNLINDSKAINNLKEMMLSLKKYEYNINALMCEKFNLAKQLEQTIQHKVVNTTFSTANTSTSINSTQNLNTLNFLMPKLPSFTDILNSFKVKETKITVIGNTTNDDVKSILHKPNDSSFVSNQSIIAKQTKHVRFKVQLEEYQMKETDSESEDSNLSQKTTLEVIGVQKTIENILKQDKQQDIEAVDLLPPTKDTNESVKDDQQDVTATTNDGVSNALAEIKMEEREMTKTPIEILECITLKAPQQPMQQNITNTGKRNMLNISPESCSAKQFSNPYSTTATPLSGESVKTCVDILNKSFYEESSSSVEVSPASKQHTILKDFESYLNHRREFLFRSKESIQNIKVNEAPLGFAQTEAVNEKNKETEQDFLDFGNAKDSFTFDSDDNITGCYNAADMNFM